MTTALIASAVLMWLVSQPPQKQPSAATVEARNRLAKLISESEGPYTRLSEGAWSTPYRGKNMASITVRVVASEGAVFFFVQLFERKSITLSRNMLIKMAELNSEYDYGKVALDATDLEIRLDVRGKLLDRDELKFLEAHAAGMADAAYGVLKDFVQ